MFFSFSGFDELLVGFLHGAWVWTGCGLVHGRPESPPRVAPFLIQLCGKAMVLVWMENPRSLIFFCCCLLGLLKYPLPLWRGVFQCSRFAILAEIHFRKPLIKMVTTSSSVVPSSIPRSSSISTVPFVYSIPPIDTAITTLSYNPTSLGTVLGYTTLITVDGHASLSTFTLGALPSGVSISNNSSGPSGTTASLVAPQTGQTSQATSTGQTSVPSNTVTEPQKSNGLQDHAGEVAGIVIGAALVLAFITFLVTFVVMRRKQHVSGPRRQHGEKANNTYLSAGNIRDPPGDHGSKQPIFTPQSVVTGPTRSLDTHLPPSADDSTVRNKISTLYEQIGLHVENFYHKSAISVPPGAETELADFESPYLPGTLALLFQQARSGVPIIKHCLTGLILSRTSPSGDPKTTFLPPEFVGLPHALEKTRSSKQKAPGTFPTHP